MKNALTNQVDMLGDVFLWLVAMAMYLVKQTCGNDILASMYPLINYLATTLF